MAEIEVLMKEVTSQKEVVTSRDNELKEKANQVEKSATAASRSNEFNKKLKERVKVRIGEDPSSNQSCFNPD